MLGFDLMKSGIYSVLPWMTMAVTSNVGGWIADSMVTRGVSITTVRKVMQTVSPKCPFASSAATGQGLLAAAAWHASVCLPPDPKWFSFARKPQLYQCRSSA